MPHTRRDGASRRASSICPRSPRCHCSWAATAAPSPKPQPSGAGPRPRPTGARRSRRDDIDVIDIVTPGDSHAEIAIAALEAGKHVLCEKPLANTVDEAAAMADAAARAAARGVYAMVGFTYRRVPAATFARELVTGGRHRRGAPGARRVPAGLARRRDRPARVAPAEGARRIGRARRHRRPRHRPLPVHHRPASSPASRASSTPS